MRNSLLTLFALVLLNANLSAQQPVGILLSTPVNFDTTENKTPIFVWNVLGSNFLSPRHLLKLTIVEKVGEQSASEALINNQPIYQRDMQNEMLHPYPFDAYLLREGFTYAWKMELFFEQTLVVSSDPFEFTIPLPKHQRQYNRLKRNVDGMKAIHNNQYLYFTVDLKSYSGNNKVEIISPSKKRLEAKIENVASSETAQNKLPMNQFDNKHFSLDIQSFNEQGNYLLKFTDGSGRKYFLKFQI